MLGLTANSGLMQAKEGSTTIQYIRDIFLTKDLPYHWWYLLFGLVGHDFLYCLLVGGVEGCGLGDLYSLFSTSHCPYVRISLFCAQLFDIIVRYDTLRNVISSVTRNITSILLTFILALIFIYDYSILGYLFFPEDFMIATNPMGLDSMAACPAGEGRVTIM